MRRPLKPFVTEYKGTRRQSPGLQPPSQQATDPTPRASDIRAFESERSRPKGAADPLRDDSDDSYEAAMRAADALFARPAAQSAERPTMASGAPRGDVDVVSSSASPDRGGRILRALDEPPPPQLVALEAAYAPKRRGRKPGSKNKPKIKPLEIASVGLAGVPEPDSAYSKVSEDRAPVSTQTVHVSATSAMRKLKAIPAAAHSPSSGSKRFSWARDRLKPGEAWKRRRLPRICW